MRRIVLAGAIAFLPAVVSAQTIDWEVINRFRLFESEKLHNTYIGRIQRLARLGSDAPLIDGYSRDKRGSLGYHHNYSTKWNEAAEQYDLRWIHNSVRRIRVTTSGVAKGSRCVWKQDGRELPDRYCSDREVNVAVGKSSVVTVDIATKGRPPKSLATTIEPKDTFIAMLGDSYGSGESNPHLTVVTARLGGVEPYPAVWWDTRCHRSMVSGPVQASALLAERDRKSSVTFVSYACSGAEINDGVRTPYEGRETVAQIRSLWETITDRPPPSDFMAVKTIDGGDKPNSRQLTPQIDRLLDTLCPPKANGRPSSDCAESERRRPDILLVSIGGNDVGFGEVGRQLLLSNPKAKTDQERKKWRSDSEKKLEPAFTSLDKDFAALAADIRAKIQPKRTLLIDYFDPTQFSTAPGKDHFCGSGERQANRFAQSGSEYRRYVASKDPKGIGFYKNSGLYNFLLTRDEAEFAQWFVRRLNERIRNAAGLAWSGTDGKAAVIEVQDLKGRDGLKRGVCAPNSWLTGIFESYKKQDWIPVDKEHDYALHLEGDSCPGKVKDDGKCYVPVGNITSGVLHPNFFGHYNFGRSILLEMEAALKR